MIAFTTFSDALMAAFASRSHEWLDWEIREHETARFVARGEPGSDALLEPSVPKWRVSVSVSVPTKNDATMGHSQIDVDPHIASPSQLVTELLDRAARNETARFRVTPWNEASAPNARDTTLPQDGESLLAEIAALVKTSCPDRAWTAHLERPHQRLRNSRGLVTETFETEISVQVGASRVFTSHRWDRTALANALSNLDGKIP